MNPTSSNGGAALVSVCVPTYNGAPFIEETIRSVLDSTWSNLEVIVCDDASTDNTAEIVERLDDARIRLFRNETRLGVPGNWSLAMEKASGDYIGLLNHDDLYGPFWLSFAVHNLDRLPHVGWVATACRFIDRAGDAVLVTRRLPETGEYGPGEAFPRVARQGAILPVYMARREVFEEAGGYDETDGPYADHGLHLRLASRYPLYYSANPLLASYRIHGGNLFHKARENEKGLRAVQCLELLDKALRGRPAPEEVREAAESCYAYFYNIILERCKTLLKEGDLETARRLIRRTPTEEYKGRFFPTKTGPIPVAASAR
ncbi:MAG: glycosyltransferase [Desulfobacterales bacterium]|nr:glycosyltransferase [Desulfobacterales bacterium]